MSLSDADGLFGYTNLDVAPLAATTLKLTVLTFNLVKEPNLLNGFFGGVEREFRGSG